MLILRQNRTGLWGVSLAVVVLLTSACIDESALPPIDVSPAMAIPSDPGPVVNAVHGATEEDTKNWDRVSLYLGASDTKPAGRGLRDSVEVCGDDRGCQDAGKRATASSDFAELADAAAAAALNGGSSRVLLSGHVDNQNRRIKGNTSVALARNRAEATAKVLKEELVDQGVPRNKIVIGAGSQNPQCSQPGFVCIQTQAAPSVIAACKGKEHCGNRTEGVGRFTAANLTIASGNRNINCVESCLTTETTVPFSPTGIGGVGGAAPNPGAGVFGPGPVLISGTTPSLTVTAPGATGSNPSTGAAGPNPSFGATDPSDAAAYCSAFPSDCPDLTYDELSVRISVAVPNVFFVGARLREQDVTVENIVLYCGDAPCPSTGAVRIGEFQGTLSLPSSSSSYRLCATPRSANCAYYLSTESTPETRSNGSSIDGGLLRAGFRSPTPSNRTLTVNVRPTLDVNVLSVDEYVPVWVGGIGCNTESPARACWEWENVDTIDMRSAVSVLTTGGAFFARSGNTHSLARTVVGTIGS